MSPPELALASPSAVRRAVLDNGLTVLIQPVHTAPLVSVWCWYRVGSKDEGPGMTGASHWVEHMNFKGTTGIPRERMKSFVERFGGTWNGYTWIDQTAYFETAAREALDEMLFLEAERMVNCLYDPAECEAERTVIISEMRGGENDPEQLLEIELTAAAFRAHPYRHPTIGWLSDLQGMTRDELYAHYRRYYLPGNAALVVVGDVEADRALELVERRFASIPAGTPPPRVRTMEPPQLGERRVVVEREGTAAYVKVAWHAPAVGDADFAAMLLLDAVLTGAKGINLWSSFRLPPPQRRARLYRALVERGLASSVSGAILPTEHPFLYTVSASVADGVPIDAVEAALLEEIDRLRAEGPSPGEIARAKRQLRARMVFETDSVTNIAHQLGYFQTVATLDQWFSLSDALAGVGPDEVATAARRRLAPSQRTVGWFRPIGGGETTREVSGGPAGPISPLRPARSGRRPAGGVR
ncbi:MAG TPA: pitrilysin family protein [Vicinamibacterales bacterium]|nr:pitrilysin family protein [Vicinamibacterales bacterium]